MVCPGIVRVASRSLNCSHPLTPTPLNLSEALAYSCNAYFVNMSQRLNPAEFANSLRKFGFDVQNAGTPDELSLMAVGEWGVGCTVAELAHAYRKLSAVAEGPILRGLAGAADYGTARLAQPAGTRVAGKTGTSATHAWFAGWAPVERPRAVVAVFVTGGRGGAHAAPIARRLFERWA
jgi:cell division protein FtsI/penicillin-binding protein 2